MPGERKVVKREAAGGAKAVAARREHQQPYASEVEDYGSDAVKTPDTDPRRKTEEMTHGDAAKRSPKAGRPQG